LQLEGKINELEVALSVSREGGVKLSAQLELALAASAAAQGEAAAARAAALAAASEAAEARSNITALEYAAKLAEARARTAAAETEGRAREAETARAREGEAKARAEAARSEAATAGDERARAELALEIAREERETASRVAATEADRVAILRGEVDSARATSALEEARARAASESARASESRASELSAEVRMWESRAKVAEAEAGKAEAEARLQAAYRETLSLELKAAALNASAASATRAALGDELALVAAQASLAIARVSAAEAEERLALVVAAREANSTAESSAREEREAAREAVRAAAALEREAKAAEVREAARVAGEKEILKLRVEADAARAEAEARGRVLEARENEALHARAAEAEALASRDRALLVARLALSTVGGALTTHALSILAWILGVVGGALFFKEALGVVRGQVTRWLGTPTLVRETSRGGGGGYSLCSILSSCCCCCRCRRGGGVASEARTVAPSRKAAGGGGTGDAFSDVFLDKESEGALRALGDSTKNAHLRGVPLRHALFYGPPGTGKTMAARRLAYHCGLDYACISGGDVAPLGPAAVTELNSLFHWAASTPRGLLLFIDEAETCLGSRLRRGGGEDSRNVLSTFLTHTGTQSSSLMLVLATNRPGDLDSAVTDRIDEAVYFGPPALPERVRIARSHFFDYITLRSNLASAGGKFSPEEPLPGAGGGVGAGTAVDPKSTIFSSASLLGCCGARGGVAVPHSQLIHISPEVTLSALDFLCYNAPGFSGRQIAKLILNIQAAAYAAPIKLRAGGAEAQGKPTITVALLNATLKKEKEKIARQQAAEASGNSALAAWGGEAEVVGSNSAGETSTLTASTVSSSLKARAPGTMKKTVRASSLEPEPSSGGAVIGEEPKGDAPKVGKRTPRRSSRAQPATEDEE